MNEAKLADSARIKELQEDLAQAEGLETMTAQLLADTRAKLAEAEAELLKYGAEIDRLQTENEELHNMVEHLLLDPRDK